MSSTAKAATVWYHWKARSYLFPPTISDSWWMFGRTSTTDSTDSTDDWAFFGLLGRTTSELATHPGSCAPQGSIVCLPRHLFLLCQPWLLLRSARMLLLVAMSLHASFIHRVQGLSSHLISRHLRAWLLNTLTSSLDTIRSSHMQIIQTSMSPPQACCFHSGCLEDRNNQVKGKSHCWQFVASFADKEDVQLAS